MSTRPVAALAVSALWLAIGTGCDEPLQPVAAETTLLAAAGDFSQWARPASREERRPVVAPHGMFVDIFINDVLVADLADAAGLARWSEGAMVVLAGFATSEADAPVQLALARKRHGQWQWEQYSEGDETPRFAGRPDVCVGCHSAGEDFMRSFRLPVPPPD